MAALPAFHSPLRHRLQNTQGRAINTILFTMVGTHGKKTDQRKQFMRQGSPSASLGVGIEGGREVEEKGGLILGYKKDPVRHENIISLVSLLVACDDMPDPPSSTNDECQSRYAFSACRQAEDNKKFFGERKRYFRDPFSENALPYRGVRSIARVSPHNKKEN
ncbi:hypothetical protein AVEN_48916-1 [Araneus ventricosus]|uniref:Uncharacterized protein n=1 Tax=Araneus ventricosus TaxID=182803 RepID=A0A4Y2AGM1_ARAVE|nr:hypothetical protein AVEN_48916-1 [Araneus ventricosus]